MAISIPDNHWCSFRRGKTWYTYQYLEKRLSEVSRYITFSLDINKETWSEELASLLILSGSAMDTFFRDMKKCPYIKKKKSYKEVHDRVKERIKEEKGSPFWEIKDYRDAYNPIYKLSENKIKVPFGIDDYGEIEPFKEFSKNGVPKWWTAYNKVKHDYYNSIKHANLNNVINCIGGLLILNILHKCSQEYLIMYRFLKSEGKINPPVLVDELRVSMIGYPSRPRHSGLILRTYIQTSQFVFKLRKDESNNKHETK